MVAPRRDGTRAWSRSWTRSGHAQQYPVVRNMADIFGHRAETCQRSPDAGRDRTPPPPSSGVLWPNELLTSPPAGGRPDHRSRAPRRPEPQAPRRQIVELHAGRLDREDRGQETEDQEHRDRDQERSPDGRDGDLARGCVHAGETPYWRMLFHARIRNPNGNLVRAVARTGGDRARTDVLVWMVRSQPSNADRSRGRDPLRRAP
jgi:hypothetical protein